MTCLGQHRSGDAAAAASIVAVARLEGVSRRAGARAYRDLLLDAGAAADGNTGLARTTSAIAWQSRQEKTPRLARERDREGGE